MSIRKKISWLFIGIVTFILICNNTVQLYWTKNIILEKERGEMKLIASIVASQIQQVNAGSLYVEDLIAQNLRTTAIAAQLALPPRAVDVSNQQLRDLSQWLQVSEITLLQKTPDGREMIGVKSTDEKEIGMKTGEWGYWNTAFLQMLNGQPVKVDKGMVLPNYWSGPLEVAASDPSHVDKYGYYYDGKTDYLINPFMRDTYVMYYNERFGPEQILKQIQASANGVLGITVFNPNTFGENGVSVETNGNQYTRLHDAPVVAGTYIYPNKRKDTTYIKEAAATGEPMEYYTTSEGKHVLKMFYPIRVYDVSYVVGIVFDYDVVQEVLLDRLRYYMLLIVLIAAGIILASHFFTKTLTTPLEKIALKVNEIASGKFGEQIDVQQKDEIGELARNVNQMSVNLRDFTNTLQRQQKEIEYQANHDALTGLPNRRYMKTYIQTLLQETKQTGEKITLFFMDLDHFKSVNDVQGHHVGDELIRLVGERLRSSLPQEVFIARQGGDEFILVSHRLNSCGAVHEFASCILCCFKEPILLKGQELFVNVSIGGSVLTQEEDDIDALIRYADIAMYDAKKAGGNQFVMYGATKSAIEEELRLQHKLARVIEEKRLDVYYQPKVDLKTEQLSGAEVLVRWYDEEDGFIPPMKFISIAEKVGLITPLWKIVMEKVCIQMNMWNKMGYTIPFSVNFSAGQFQHTDQLVADIQYLLRTYGVSPHVFEMEITESALMEAGAVEALQRIKELGIRVSVDDFGTGYSSLSYLESFPLDTIKIDRSFIGGMEDSDRKCQIVELIIAFAKKLGLKVIAEGVETEAQQQLLSDWKCDEMQGYLFSKPLPAQEFEERFLTR
ncbi:EAL domain-containing protein [Ectobacillus sp. JY-23]|uniref:EAL domain-containing protein n=1 Tax=Ectobacillus sp. JY-23 TaxID=2933872 RepID=UPI001FF16023|nr:EAL domain-containing protein [Ectobacillus sp. JY-23]UOY93356.1 EAL domain-containing protein [Ectobacillus sp. JY-23]